MSLELAALITTGIVSTFDLLVNIATLCFTGRCRSDCCGFHFEHDEDSIQPRITESQMDDIKHTIENTQKN